MVELFNLALIFLVQSCVVLLELHLHFPLYLFDVVLELELDGDLPHFQQLLLRVRLHPDGLCHLYVA